MRVVQTVPSTEMISVEIRHKVAGMFIDPTVDYVGYLSFKPSRYPEPGSDYTATEWHPASWETGRGYFLVVLLGPNHSGIDLGAGTWHVFAGLDGAVEMPIAYAGVRQIR